MGERKQVHGRRDAEDAEDSEDAEDCDLARGVAKAVREISGDARYHKRAGGLRMADAAHQYQGDKGSGSGQAVGAQEPGIVEGKAAQYRTDDAGKRVGQAVEGDDPRDIGGASTLADYAAASR